MMKYVLFSFLLVVAAIPVQAQVQGAMTAIELQNLCNSRYDVDAGMCAGYIMAIAERLQQDPNPIHRVCLSPAVSPQTLVDNLLRGWESSPPQPHDLATDSVAGLLRDRFRCP